MHKCYMIFSYASVLHRPKLCPYRNYPQNMLGFFLVQQVEEAKINTLTRDCAIKEQVFSKHVLSK